MRGDTNELKAMNRKLADLAAVIYVLQGYEEAGGPNAACLYQLLSDNLNFVWKQHARILVPVRNLDDDIARELGYAALSVYCAENRVEQAAFRKATKLICEMLLDWGKAEIQQTGN